MVPRQNVKSSQVLVLIFIAAYLLFFFEKIYESVINTNTWSVQKYVFVRFCFLFLFIFYKFDPPLRRTRCDGDAHTATDLTHWKVALKKLKEFKRCQVLFISKQEIVKQKICISWRIITVSYKKYDSLKELDKGRTVFGGRSRVKDDSFQL